ncbi:MAG: hypothetical protein ACRDGD_01110 [Candidatus Limnocylindria bacterium]
MSRCRQTDALLDATFAGIEISRAQADHAASCTDCARALSQHRRFENELGRVGVELSPEPMPPASEVATAVTAVTVKPGVRFMSSRRNLLVAGAGAAVLAVAVFLGGQWLGSTLGDRGGVGGIAPQALNAWLDRALPAIISETGRRGADAAEWTPIQVEVCGGTAIAFWAEPGGVRAYRWGIGDPMNRLVALRAGGLAATLSDTDVAEVRATLPMCSTVVDPSMNEERALLALGEVRERWERERRPIPGLVDLSSSHVIDTALGAPGQYRLLLERDGMERVGSLYLFTLAGGDDRSFRMASMSYHPGLVARPLAVYRLVSGDYVGLIDDDRVTAVELIGPGGHLRYPIEAPGFILEVDLPADALIDYRFLDASGRGIGSGEIRAAPGGK